MQVFWVKSIAGVRMRADSRSEDTVTRGLAIITAVISAIRVVRILCVRRDDPH